MTDDNSNLVDIGDDLNEFEQDFFQAEKANLNPEDVTEDNDEQESLDDSHEEENPLATEDEDENEEVEEESPKPKKKASFQERIDELTAKAREAERREAATQAELARLRQELEANSKQQEVKDPPKVELREHLPDNAPNPDAKGEDGEPLYPLGEFDPLYIRDLTKFTIEQETAKAKEAAEREAAQKAQQEEIARVQTEWNTRVEAVKETMPDFQDKVSGMVDAFQGIDPGYGDYLAMTIMQSEVGPEMLYYLADNIGEAQKIVASGPAAATLAIGRLEAQLSKPKEETKRNKVSEAAPPPETRTRGSGGRFTVSPDTDDLDAFEKEYFNR